MDLAPGRRARLLVALALVVLVALAARSGAEVITLTEETFSDKIKEKDTVWFVKFCVPWCKHCKNLGTLWEDLGKVMEGADEIEIGQVDCGPRNVESLKNFVSDEAEKAGEAKLQDS
uniref:Thioredoxin domain-containing protein n=1 Tax=Oryza nivara TaxID=4536 RepID=A0A0E0GL02_ORYNI